MWHRTIDCLGLAVDVTSHLLELAAPLSAVLRTYADSSRRVDVAYELAMATYPRLVRDGAVVSEHDLTTDLVPAFEIDLYKKAISAVPGLVLHASALVGASGAAIVFTGRSGAGKSTLLRSLLQRGFRYLSEECVALFANQRCLGLARSLHVDDPDVPLPAGYACDDYFLRNRPGRPLRLFHPPEHVMWRGEARTAAVVAIDHRPDADGALLRLTGGSALAALWPTVFRQDAAALELAGAGLDGVPTFQLLTARPEQALEHALALSTELGV